MLFTEELSIEEHSIEVLSIEEHFIEKFHYKNHFAGMIRQNGCSKLCDSGAKKSDFPKTCKIYIVNGI